jgi:hypothetical protein
LLSQVIKAVLALKADLDLKVIKVQLTLQAQPAHKALVV